MRLPLRALVGMVKEALTRPASSLIRLLAITWPSQRSTMPDLLGVKLMPVTAIPVWPRRPRLGVICSMAGGLSNTA